jgi:hypothetical protein
MTFVGVNGVGKSTNLSKVCFWLLQNGYRVLIAACDTFRSGAVEQLRVHVRNLGALAQEGGGNRVELFERGYGKDAAGIAKDAIAYGMLSARSSRLIFADDVAKENKFDVVLIDTAGRMQPNEGSSEGTFHLLFALPISYLPPYLFHAPHGPLSSPLFSQVAQFLHTTSISPSFLSIIPSYRM